MVRLSRGRNKSYRVSEGPSLARVPFSPVKQVGEKWWLYLHQQTPPALVADRVWTECGFGKVAM